ncbi:protein ALP1-like protein [Lates japonicus]|uniref:Protein ALP1-like protein n=1 Tax=Lates japonicus TaxID=270547 RepID=A0AAD3MY36_LATJO|nr:protein ALP1-like protein [Lates japonicus]
MLSDIVEHVSEAARGPAVGHLTPRTGRCRVVMPLNPPATQLLCPLPPASPHQQPQQLGSQADQQAAPCSST